MEDKSTGKAVELQSQFSVSLGLYFSELDGVQVVQIDTPVTEDSDFVEASPRLRVYLNDSTIYENPPYLEPIENPEEAKSTVKIAADYQHELDELVHDDLSGRAAEINSEGVEGQLEYLRSVGMEDDEIITRLQRMRG